MQSKSKLTLEQIPCGYLATNLASEITAINSTLCGWLGVNESDMIGQHINTLLSMPSRMLFLGNILPTLQQKHVVEENYLQFKVIDNESIPLMINAQKIEPDGKPYWNKIRSYKLYRLQTV